MRLALSLKTILLAIAVVAVSFFVSLKAMDWLSPRGTVGAPVLVELPPLPPAPRSLEHHGAGRDRAGRDSRRRRPRRAAHLRRQGRQSGVADPAERRHRLDRLARADRRDRRPGRAVAGHAADRNAECHGLAVRRRRPARSATRSAACSAATSPSRSAASTSRRSTPAPRSRATSSSPRGRSSPRPGASSRIWPRRSRSATAAFRWPARASMSRRRSSR